jgi:branched-chain amino acid transport system ATP-binding protein
VSAAQAGLELRDLGVRFGGVQAIDEVSLSVRASQVHGLVGPNGSGKTTILNAVCAFVESDGEIHLGDKRIDRFSAHRRIELGLGRTFQNPRPVRELTVRDLLRIGEHQRRTQPWWQVALTPRAADRALRESNARAVRLLSMLGIGGALLDEQLINLPAGVLKMVDIARALMGAPQALLLDEPTSGMNDAEIGLLHAALRELRTGALTILLVEHNLRFMFDICDSMTVLETGRVIGHGTPVEVFQREDVIRAYMGSTTPPDRPPGAGDRAVEVSSVPPPPARPMTNSSRTRPR